MNWKRLTAAVNRPSQKPEILEPWLKRRLIREHFSGLFASLFGNFVNIVVISYIFWSPAIAANILIGNCIFTIVCARRYWLGRNWRQIGLNARAIDYWRKRIEVNAITLGSCWGATVCAIMMFAEPSDALLAGILGAGMTAAGALTYREIPNAAKSYVGACAIGSSIGLLSIGTTAAIASCILLCSFAVVLIANINRTYRNIAKRYKRESDLRQSAETINMLLTDFTEQGSDWLLELDVQGRVVNPTERFAEIVERPLESLEGVSFLNLINDGPEKDGLIDHMKCRRAFRNFHVSTHGEKETHCWSINARPVRDPRVKYRFIITDITAQRQAEARVSYMAHFDALTDLPNRFQFQNCMSESLQSEGGELTLLFLDLDEFKNINDTLGHGAGDLMLKRVAQRLKDCVEPDAVVARLGGDEFAILLPYNDKERVQALCESILVSFDKPYSLDGNDVVVGTSIGVAAAPEHGRDVTTLLSNADLALYEAKSAGRNRYTYFEQGMDVDAQNRRELEKDLRNAVKQNELCLHYQPLINVDSGEPNGYEALIRWEHPQRGVVMPDQFIAIAEDSGLIIQIGEWVIRQALDDMSGWPEDRNISINLSPAQMRSPSLITTMVQALAKAQVDASRVCLEITESVLMHDSDANIATLHKLRELGVKIALDDFGTGYSSLNYLRSFPFDKIKIDRCFISEIDSREDCQAIVRSVVNLANSLGMTTTAEGVERADQLEMLRGEGCTEVQGYLYSQAMPQEQLSDLRSPVRSQAQKLAEIEQERDRVETALDTKEPRQIGSAYSGKKSASA